MQVFSPSKVRLLIPKHVHWESNGTYILQRAAALRVALAMPMCSSMQRAAHACCTTHHCHATPSPGEPVPAHHAAAGGRLPRSCISVPCEFTRVCFVAFETTMAACMHQQSVVVDQWGR